MARHHGEVTLLSFGKLSGCLLAAALSLLANLAIAAQDNVRITPLSETDGLYMAQQRASLNELAEAELGRSFNQNKDNDLQILQLLLDRR